MNRALCAMAVVLAWASGGAGAGVEYAIEDGFAELALGIDPDEDLVWLNTFEGVSGGGVIDSVTVGWGRPGGVSGLNGRTATLVLYADATGGSPQDATLLWSQDVVIANANQNVLNTFAVPLVSVGGGGFAVGVIYRNLTNQQRFIAGLDQSAPSLAGRSYLGFGVGVDAGDLGSIDGANFRAVEDFGFVGNFVVRAHGVPGPATGAVLGAGIAWGARRRRGRGRTGGG